MDKKCIVCNKMFYAKRADARFDSPACRKSYSRQEDGTTITETTTPVISETTNEWFNSAETKTQAEIEAHYTLENFPPLKYYSSGGGGTGALTPPRLR